MNARGVLVVVTLTLLWVTIGYLAGDREKTTRDMVKVQMQHRSIAFGEKGAP